MAAVANKRSVMTLYSDPTDPYCHRVRLVLAEKNITYEVSDIDPLNVPEEVMELNPYGTLPTLVDRDLKLYESRIIMEYLDERFPHPPLLPVDPVSRSTSRLLMYRVDNDWYSLMDIILSGKKEAAKARKELRESLISTSPVFNAKPFFMSEEFTLVDCAIAPLLWRLQELGVEIPASAKGVHEYTKRLFEKESFIKSLSEAEQEMRG
ncbi:MAG: glutathione S-transferase N-terminal domain-containing protein [Candidatus Thiodiazotropha sp. (ex Lucina aurantia)]|uniref:Stringent starvation protein A n=2 Tax=Candidatus Thiodiazotropha TaxID=1913444 RepID=A0A7Z0VKS5_9GAMM|nr:glutathione S-transferase N-terminal domain-containing protein [Candidatus Thiodiazotropha endolucinida]MBT3013037.1 glutathione S-transferase N-terminal domain-containing protein [Candidatus Thiodiazotropha sp. (ex Lucina pensylvanica)]MBT3017007.1 glutathione S-transferase N-terminal domain-containing protein [Candidatus Thiodiazotropha taylori]MBT3037369.1 glutathione S-transferase N-terminal domain-containing protein [Candidatus Thiodiazotropha sp. (ex Codakia orbicularis)]MBV2101837.1 g